MPQDRVRKIDGLFQCRVLFFQVPDAEGGRRVNWELCIVCQTTTIEAVKCPGQLTAFLSQWQKPIRASWRMLISSGRSGISRLHSHSLKVTQNFSLKNVQVGTRLASWSSRTQSWIGQRKNVVLMLHQQVQHHLGDRHMCFDVDLYLFCQDGTNSDLICFCILEADEKIRLMATELEDETLLARLAGGDLIAIEANYHKACPTKLDTRFRTFQRKKSSDDNAEENIVTSRVFVELIEYIDNETQSERTSIALTELHELYVRRLQQFGFGAYVHKTHLKERILKHFPECKPEFDGRTIVLLFDNTLRIMVRETLKQSADLDAMTLMKAAKIKSDAIFCHMRIWNSQGTFPRVVKNNHYRRVYLRYSPWLCMRTDINTDNDHHQPCMSLAQLVSFNTVAQQRSKSQLSRHGFVNRRCQSTLVLTSIRELEVRPSSRSWTAWGCVCHIPVFFRLRSGLRHQWPKDFTMMESSVHQNFGTGCSLLQRWITSIMIQHRTPVGGKFKTDGSLCGLLNRLYHQPANGWSNAHVRMCVVCANVHELNWSALTYVSVNVLSKCAK